MTNKDKKITAYDFLQYHKNPHFFLFKDETEKRQLLDENTNFAFLEELLEDDPTEILDFFFSSDNLLIENTRKIHEIVQKHLKKFLKEKLQINDQDFYDFSKSKSTTERIFEILKTPKNVFIFKPKIENSLFVVSPMAIYKYEGKIYIFESTFSTTLKREMFAKIIFNEHLLTKIFNLQIAQHLIVYFEKKINPIKTISFLITVGLPFNSKKHSTIDPVDKKLKNINSLFEKDDLTYEDSIFPFFLAKEDFLKINNGDWKDFFYDEILFLKEIDEIEKIKNNPIKDFDFLTIAQDFLKKAKSLIPVDGSLYKLLLQKCFKNFDFSGKIFPFSKLLKKLITLDGDDEREKFLSFISNLSFLEVPETKNMDFFLFSNTEHEIFKLQTDKTFIYYDFETISLPFALFYPCKPFSQIVVQMSLIKIKNGIEEVNNIVLDPKKFHTDQLKDIIDALFVEEDASYIVYNKSFENTRLKEINALINNEEYFHKINKILENTIDLADWFVYGNNPLIIHKKLKGFHSIKKVINIIPEKLLLESKTKNYSDLEECKNGINAQQMIMSRIFASDSENKEEMTWESYKKHLVKYCENDVRSMIATKLFIEELLKNISFFYSIEEYILKKKELSTL